MSRWKIEVEYEDGYSKLVEKDSMDECICVIAEEIEEHGEARHLCLDFGSHTLEINCKLYRK